MLPLIMAIDIFWNRFALALLFPLAMMVLVPISFSPHYIDLSFRIHREHPTPACPEILDHQRSHPRQARGGFRPAPRSWQKRGTPRHTRTHQGRKHEGEKHLP